jgi:HSP20 family protein
MSLLESLTQIGSHGSERNNNGHSGPSAKPQFDIIDSRDGYALTVHLPGVAKQGLEITAENNLIRVVGRRAWKQPENWTTLYSEFDGAPYELVLEHDNSVDIPKIRAELHDGILRVALPKAEALKPRKIAVS